jgi:NAD-dependent SIR2 family protein deacetylase
MLARMDASPAAALADFATRHRKLFVLTGAGCSTESGIPDYRDEKGEWKRPSPVTYQAFMGEESTRRRYWARSLIGWPTMAGARPGAAHRALAQLEAAGPRGPAAHAERRRAARRRRQPGRHRPAWAHRHRALHGLRAAHAARGTAAELRERNPRWAALEARAAPDGDADLEGHDFSAFDVPACAHCGGLLKPDVVFFGESVPKERVTAAFAALEEADAVLVAGSSLMVYSGFRFVQAAAAAGKPVAAVNLGRTRADELLTLKVERPVGEALTELAQQFMPDAQADRIG